MAVVQGALAALPVRAGEAGTGGAALEDRVRAGLQERIDAWRDRAVRMKSGARLGYNDGRDGVTIGLLQMPGASAWDTDPARRALPVHKILSSLDRFLDSYHDDGGCPHGGDRHRGQPAARVMGQSPVSHGGWLAGRSRYG